MVFALLEDTSPGAAARNSGSTPVFAGSSRVLWSTKEQSARAGRGSEGELVESDNFTASLEDASAGCGGHFQSADGELGNFQQSGVIGNSADKDNGLVLFALGHSSELRN